MKIDRRVFLKRANWTLAGMIGMLGFSGCERVGAMEYGTPHADYTVKGAVVNKATGKPIEGIQVRYVDNGARMYGPPPTNYKPKASVLTNANGEFLLKDRFNAGEVQMIDNKPTLPVAVMDEKGLFQPEVLMVDFSDAKQIGKPKGWSEGEFLITQSIGLTEIKS